ncbi:unnamed protein product [Caenorhabditis brenneri]
MLIIYETTANTSLEENSLVWVKLKNNCRPIDRFTMADKNSTNLPCPPPTGQTIGRGLKGPFKRHVDGALAAAKASIKHADKFLRENARAADTPYSAEETDKIKDLVADLHQQLTTTRSLPQHLTQKISNPIFQTDPKYDETVEEMKEYLKASEFERLITQGITSIAMFEQECSIHNIELDEFAKAEYSPDNFEALGDDEECYDKVPLIHQTKNPNSLASNTEMLSDEVVDPNLPIDPEYLQELKIKAKAIETTNLRSETTVPQHRSFSENKEDLENDRDVITIRERADQYEKEIAAQRQKDHTASQFMQKTDVQSHPTVSHTPQSNILKPANVATNLPISQDHYNLMIHRIEQLEKEKQESQAFQKSLVERMERMQLQYSREDNGPGIPTFKPAPENNKSTNNHYDEPEAYSTDYESDASYVTAERPRHSRNARLRRDKSKPRSHPRGMSIDKRIQIGKTRKTERTFRKNPKTIQQS